MAAPSRIQAARRYERNGRITITFDCSPAVLDWILRRATADDMRPGTWVRTHFTRLAAEAAAAPAPAQPAA